MKKLLLILLLIFPLKGMTGVEDHPLRIPYKNSDAPINHVHYNYILAISKTVFINGEKHKFHALASPLFVHKKNQTNINYPYYKKLKLVVGYGSSGGYGSSARSQYEANKQAIADCKKTNRWDYYSGTSRNPNCIIIAENKNVVFEKNYNNFLSTIDSTKQKWAKIENEQDSYELVENDFSHVKSTMKKEEMEGKINTSTTLSSNNSRTSTHIKSCKTYGFKEKTVTMGECVLKLMDLEIQQMKIQNQIINAQKAEDRQRLHDLQQQKILEEQKYDLGLLQLQQAYGILNSLNPPKTTCTFNALMNNMVCR